MHFVFGISSYSLFVDADEDVEHQTDKGSAEEVLWKKERRGGCRMTDGLELTHAEVFWTNGSIFDEQTAFGIFQNPFCIQLNAS